MHKNTLDVNKFRIFKNIYIFKDVGIKKEIIKNGLFIRQLFAIKLNKQHIFNLKKLNKGLFKIHFLKFYIPFTSDYFHL